MQVPEPPLGNIIHIPQIVLYRRDHSLGFRAVWEHRPCWTLQRDRTLRSASNVKGIFRSSPLNLHGLA